MFRAFTLLFVGFFSAVFVACSGAGSTSTANLPPGDMTLKEFVLQKPSTATAVQVLCELDTYYNYSYSGCADTYYSFHIKSESPFATKHAYAPKNSAHGKKLYDSLKDGSLRPFTIELQRVGPDKKKLPTEQDNCFAITALVEGKK